MAERSNMVYMNTLTGVIVLQAVAVHWPPAQVVFGTEILSIRDWGIATGVASSILLLEEGRKLMVALFARVSPRTKTLNPTTRQPDSSSGTIAQSPEQAARVSK